MITRALYIAALLISLVSYTFFSLGFIFDFAWEFGWMALLFQTVFWIALGVRSLYSSVPRYDVLLFNLGTLLFMVIDPSLVALTDDEFPTVWTLISNEDSTGNLTGIVISIFSIGFHLGNFFSHPTVPADTQRFESYSRSTLLQSSWILLFSIALAIGAFFISVQSLTIDGMAAVLFARSTGNVAFATAGLGNESPFITLLASCIPATSLICFSSLEKGKGFKNIVLLFFAALFMILFMLTGGRSVMVLILLSCMIFWLVKSHKKPRLFYVGGVATILFVALLFQINFRDDASISDNEVFRSPLEGFALNREIAFIVERFGTKEKFTSSDSLFVRSISPLPETFVLFFSNPVPRIFWESKPIDSSFGPYNVLRTGSNAFGASTNVTPTIPGRYFMKYGLPGVIQIAIVFGLVWGTINKQLLKSSGKSISRVLIFSTLSVIMLLSLRDFTPGKFYPVLFLILPAVLDRLRLKKVINR